MSSQGCRGARRTKASVPPGLPHSLGKAEEVSLMSFLPQGTYVALHL